MCSCNNFRNNNFNCRNNRNICPFNNRPTPRIIVNNNITCNNNMTPGYNIDNITTSATLEETILTLNALMDSLRSGNIIKKN